MSKLQNKIGPPVEGADFFGRSREIQDARQSIESGNHLLIVAPRRVGKSSFAKKMIREFRQNNWKGMYIDVQAITTELGFLELFSAEVKEISKGWFKRNVGKAQAILDTVISKIALEWETDAGKISLGLGGAQKTELKDCLDQILKDAGNLLIAIDELPYFLSRLEAEPNGHTRISDFLHLLRFIRQKSDNHVRWIFCGSIGLDTFAGRHKLTSTLNDLLAFDLAAFDEGTARAFLEKLGKDNHMSLTKEQINYMLELIGWPLPYFLQAHFGQLKRLVDSGRKIDEASIAEAYRNIILTVSALKTWDERLDAQLPEHADLCRAILRMICQNKKGLSRSTLADQLYRSGDDPDRLKKKLSISLDMLKHDGYLILDNKQYIFRSPLLRDYWNELHVK